MACGADIQQVSLVINYDLQIPPEKYLHYIRRSGRLGRKGVAINIMMQARPYARLHLINKKINEHYLIDEVYICTPLLTRCISSLNHKIKECITPFTFFVNQM